MKEIANKGQLTTTKMFDLPDELKKISAGKIETKKKEEEVRGRGFPQEMSVSNLDKQAKRALKKRRQRARKREEKRRA